MPLLVGILTLLSSDARIDRRIDVSSPLLECVDPFLGILLVTGADDSTELSVSLSS